MLRRKSALKARGTAAPFDLRKLGIAKAAEPVVCEVLEPRRLLSTYTYQVPSGTTAVYIEGDPFSPGVIKVRLNSETAPFVSPDPFTNTTGMSIIQAPTGSSGFLFVDKVPAKLKPGTDGDDDGIKVEAPSGSGATLRIDRRTFNRDQYIQVTDSSSTSTTVRVFNNEQGNFVSGYSRLGEGVSHLTLQTNEVQATDYFPAFTGGTDVVVRNLVSGVHLTVDTGAGTYDRIWLGTNELLQDGHLVEEAKVITGAGRCIVTVRGEDGPLTRARLDFGPRSQTGHNRLEVKLNGVATLAQLAGANHRVVVEEVNLDSIYSAKPATLYVEDPSDIDDLQEIEQGHACIEPTADGTEVVSWLVNPTCTASIQGETTIGTFTIEGEVEFTGTSAPSTVDEFRVGAATVPESNGTVNVLNGADVTALTNSKIGTLNFPDTPNSGTLTLQARPIPHTPTNARKLIVKSLSMNTSNTSKLDLKDNAMIIDYTGSSPLASIQAMITSAYNASGTLWTGNALGSSTAAANNAGTGKKTGVGFAEATDLFTFPLPSPPPTWEGHVPDSTMVLVKYTYYGDANLDGSVTLQDFNRVAANFGQSPRRWATGDFNFDNVVNLQDFNRLAANFGQGGFGPGDGTEEECLAYTQEELQEMWNEQTGG